jgi:hypothetical protein
VEITRKGHTKKYLPNRVRSTAEDAHDRIREVHLTAFPDDASRHLRIAAAVSYTDDGRSVTCLQMGCRSENSITQHDVANIIVMLIGQCIKSGTPIPFRVLTAMLGIEKAVEQLTVLAFICGMLTMLLVTSFLAPAIAGLIWGTS